MWLTGRLTVLVWLLSATLASAANWVDVGQATTAKGPYTILADLDSFTVPTMIDPRFEMQIRVEFGTSQQDTFGIYRSYQANVEFDCKDNTVRPRNERYYQADGQLLNAPDAQDSPPKKVRGDTLLPRLGPAGCAIAKQIGSSPGPDWKHIASTSQQEVYLSLRGVRRQAGMVTAWLRYQDKRPVMTSTNSGVELPRVYTLGQVRLNCIARQSTVLTAVFYGADGQAIVSDQGPPNDMGQAIVPNSVIDAVATYYCAKPGRRSQAH